MVEMIHLFTFLTGDYLWNIKGALRYYQGMTKEANNEYHRSNREALEAQL